MVDFPKRIKSDGFWLEKVKPTFEVANHLFNIVKNQRAYLAKWLEWVDFSNSPEDMYPHLLKSSQTNNANYYIVLNKEVIGAISFVNFSEKNKIAEIGYWLSFTYNGKGIMTKAVKTLEDYGFQKLKLNRIEIRADIENKKSWKVPVRAGYKKEGILRQSSMLRGEARDIVVYSKLKSEWEKGK